jgi:hypothetical protein
MSSYADYEKMYLEPLRAEGLFVRILGVGDYNQSVKVECRLYITDIDDEMGTTNLLEMREDDPLRSDEHGLCVACRAAEGEVRPTVRGSVTCPLCGVQTMAWWLRERRYCADFLLFGSGPAIVFDAEADEGVKPMPPMIAQMIGEALSLYELHVYELMTPPVSPEELDTEAYEDDDEIPPVNLGDLHPILVNPFEEEDRAAFYAERHPSFSWMCDSP